MRIRAFMATVAIVPTLASAAPPVHLAPSSPWVVDYAENSCRLVRRFGEGNHSITLAFDSEAPGFLDMLVIGRPLANNLDDVPVNFVPTASEPMSGTSNKTVDKSL